MTDRPALLPPPGGTAVVAVSGGLDSTVLARTWAPLLARWGCRAVLAHVDHELRGDDSDADRAFVVALAEELGLPLRVASLPPDADAVDAVGLEAALRASRRAFLRTVAAQHGATHVYLGHHRDDQIETVVLRLMQGAPADRVTGMRALQGPFARPLLTVPRARLRALAEEHGWAWREDASNRDESHPRNRIRHTVLPALRAEDPRFDEALLLAAAEAEERRGARDVEVEALAPRAVVRAVDGAARIRPDVLRAAPPDVALALLQRICDPGDLPRRPPNRAALSALIELPPGRSRRLDLGGGWTARLERDELRLLRDAPLSLESAAPTERLWTEDATSWPGGWRFRRRLLSPEEARDLVADPGAGRLFALFDADALARPLSVVAAPDDRRLRPYGLDGSATVRRLLAEAGVPRSRRAAHPAIVDGDGNVLWLPGVRAAHVAPLDRGSRQALLLYTEQSPDVNRGTSPTGRHAETA